MGSYIDFDKTEQVNVNAEVDINQSFWNAFPRSKAALVGVARHLLALSEDVQVETNVNINKSQDVDVQAEVQVDEIAFDQRRLSESRASQSGSNESRSDHLHFV